MARRPTGAIAIRTLRDAKSGSRTKVTVALGMPRKAATGEWACWFQVRGLGADQRREGHGIDAFQALLMAFEGIRFTLGRKARSLAWEGGMAGDTGFPRFVPAFYGVKFARKIERFIDGELRRFSRGQRDKYRRVQRARSTAKRKQP
jgi:hypothetical protein